MNKLEIKITENKSGGKILSYHLMTKRGEGSFVGGGEIRTTDEMREIAIILVKKAEEIEIAQYKKMMNEPNLFCESCGQVLYDENTIKIDNGSLPIYVCTDCATWEEKNNG